VGGGALLFVTGGLAAPALAAALTTAGVTGVAVTTLVRMTFTVTSSFQTNNVLDANNAN
jgi:hypothetical protein